MYASLANPSHIRNILENIERQFIYSIMKNENHNHVKELVFEIIEMTRELIDLGGEEESLLEKNIQYMENYLSYINENDPYIQYEIGMSHMQLKNTKKAEFAFQDAFVGAGDDDQLQDTLLALLQKNFNN